MRTIGVHAVHIVGDFQHFLDRLGVIPRALCGVRLLSTAEDEELDRIAPVCPQCVERAGYDMAQILEVSEARRS